MDKVRVENLSFKYPLADSYALSNITFDVKKSDFVVLCGKSGCGKSTLLRQLKKQMIPYGEKTGCVYIDGVDIDKMDERDSVSKIGFIQQNPEAQIVTDKVWHELAFGLENLGVESRIIKRRVAEMASYFGIQNWFRKDINQLSGGQKQLLNLASVMVMQPEILILDEPTSQLDPIATSEFLNTLYRINKEFGTTIIISEHRLEEVIPMASKVMVMDKSKIIACNSPEYIAQDLYHKNEEKIHPMFYGFPTVMRVFQCIADVNKMPLTIRDGRLLLERLLSNTSYEDEPISDNLQTNYYDIAFQLKDIWFKYSRGSEFVLKGVNLKVYKGSWHCILGGNGTGKSTLLKVICGALEHQRGKRIVAERQRISMVPQNPQSLFTEITVEEELFEGISHMDYGDDKKITKVEDMLKILEIEHLRKSNPYDLSGGEQQRLAIGKILLTEPDILLLDEPTKGLDPFFKRSLARIFKRLNKMEITILMVSHDIEFCAEFGEKCSMFFDGEIVSEDSARDFFTGNSFYTTAANKLFRGYNRSIVTCEEAEEWLKKRDFSSPR